ncbi:MAG: hypothetical protein M1393_06945 [Candidatus Thermoplasmatota archaeon]|nr:hypothetical protein [Candidatus Thermoplasmatota archaeon]
MSNERTFTIAFVCNILGHGNTYDEWSTSFVIAMSMIEAISKIHIIVPPPKEGKVAYKLPEKCIIHGILDYDHPINMIKAVNLIYELECDSVIVVSGPTAFGNGIVSNLIGLLLPLLIQRKIGKEVKIINQGSAYTHNVGSLGYSGIVNSMKLLVVRSIEKFIFKRLKTYFQLGYYCNIVEAKLGKNYVGGLLVSDYIDALATLYLNNMDNSIELKRYSSSDHIRILLHGFWGPQKDPETALESVQNIKLRYPEIHLTISGGINNHFPGYLEYFKSLLKKYESIIDAYLGYVDEKELAKLFLENHIVLMPYRASGGQSGVLEMASFFENVVVCSDFPEFREEKKSDLVVLTDLMNFEPSLLRAFEMVDEIPNIIHVQNKIETVIKNIKNFLAD